MFQYKLHTLLDMTYGRCKAANSFELVVMSMKRLLTNNETEQLLVARLSWLEHKKVLDLKPHPCGFPPQQVML